jgi:hypothetical protein
LATRWASCLPFLNKVVELVAKHIDNWKGNIWIVLPFTIIIAIIRRGNSKRMSALGGVWTTMQVLDY